MNSETRQKSASNSGSSSVKSDQSINYQTAEYGHFFWATYFHQLNQQSMVNLSTQERPQDNLNLTQPLTQGSHYSPISSSSSSSSPLASLSSNMKDLCRYNPSNSFTNGKNPQIDNNSSNCRPNYDDWNSRDDINRYTTNGVRSNQYSISENSDGDCPQKLALDENRYKKEMAAVIEQIQRRAEYQGYPIIHAKSPYKCPTREYTVVDEHRMDEIIAKELDLALSLSKKGRKNSRSHRLNQQTKQKTRPKTGKKSSIKDKLISITVERIKAAVFNCTPNLPSARANKKSDHGSNQQSTQNQSFHQPEAWNQYQEYHIPGQFQHPQLMCKPKPEVLRQPADPQPLTRKPKRYCTCKKRNGRVNNDVPSSSASVSNHFNVSSADFNSTNSIYGLHHR